MRPRTWAAAGEPTGWGEPAPRTPRRPGSPAPASPTLPPMIPASDDVLFGRIALHYKLVTREQLLEASELQALRGGQLRLGEILVDKGYLKPQQVAQILTVQRDYVARQHAQ